MSEQLAIYEAERRPTFMAEMVRISIAYQLRCIRAQRGWSQTEMAKAAKSDQATISRLEDWNSAGIPNINHLLEIAQALDIALLVRFGTWNEFVKETGALVPDYEQETGQKP